MRFVDRELAVGEQLHQHGARSASSARQGHDRSALGATRVAKPSAWAPCALSTARGLVLTREIEQMEQRVRPNAPSARSSRPPARRWRAPGTILSSSARAAVSRAPAACAQIAAGWLLPEPSGPVSITARCGQSGHRSIGLSAAAFEGPRKSSRAKPPCLERKRDWRGATAIRA